MGGVEVGLDAVSYFWVSCGSWGWKLSVGVSGNRLRLYSVVLKIC